MVKATHRQRILNNPNAPQPLKDKYLGQLTGALGGMEEARLLTLRQNKSRRNGKELGVTPVKEVAKPETTNDPATLFVNSLQPGDSVFLTTKNHTGLEERKPYTVKCISNTPENPSPSGGGWKYCLDVPNQVIWVEELHSGFFFRNVTVEAHGQILDGGRLITQKNFLTPSCQG